MKKLGLIGGMSPESTIAYYHDVVYGVRKKLGYDCFPDISIESIDLYKWVKLCEEKRYEAMTEYTLDAIKNVAQSGADFAVLSANTAHIIFDDLSKRSPVPLISIVEATCDEAKRRGCKTIGLMGTGFTMENDFFKKPFEREGIEVVIPDKKDRDYIHKSIYSDIVCERLRPQTKEGFIKIAKKMKQDCGIEALVLGCTELPLIFKEADISIPYLDTVKIHVDAIIKEILKN